MKTKEKLVRPNLYDYLKVLALITMLIDHIGYYLFPQYDWLRLIWRVAFPVFLFLVWFSWSYKRRRDIPIIGICLRIGLLLCNKFLDIWMGNWLNILIAICLARVFLSFIDKHRNIRIIVFSCCLLCLIHPYLKQILGYWSFSFLFALRWWIAKNYKRYFHIWIIPLFGLLVYSIYVFKFGFFQWDLTKLYILCSLFTIIYFLFFALSQNNITLKINKRRDSFILQFSKHALAFYWIHISILFFLCLWKFWYIF